MSNPVQSLFGNIEFPSGDVTQPWSWWYQFAPVTINQMKTGDPALERRIVHEVASYGRQLGRISDALEAVIAAADLKGLDESQRKAISDFSAMAEKIAGVKGGLESPTPDNLDKLVAALRHWKAEDSALYAQARRRLLEVLGEDRPKSAR